MFNLIVNTFYKSLVFPTHSSVTRTYSAKAGGIGSKLLVLFTLCTTGLIVMGLSLRISRWFHDPQDFDVPPFEGIISALNRYNPLDVTASDDDSFLFFYSSIAVFGLGFFVTSSTLFDLKRYFHFLLMFASPFAVVGLYGMINVLREAPIRINSQVVVALFLITSLGLNSGVVTEFSNEKPKLMFGLERVEVTNADVHSSSFVMNHSRPEGTEVYSSTFAFPKFYSGYFKVSPSKYRKDEYALQTISLLNTEIHGYLLIYSHSHSEGEIQVFRNARNRLNVINVDVDRVTSGEGSSLNRIYDNGGSTVYHP